MLIVLQLFFLVLLGSAAYAGLKAAPWVPTGKKSLQTCLDLCELVPGQTIFDLGSGDGRLLLAAADRDVKAIGYEMSLGFYLLSQVRTLFHPKRALISTHWSDFWKADWCEADVIYVFLTRRIYPKLCQKLLAETKPGTKVVTYIWPIDGWTADAVGGLPGRELYLYTVKAV